MPSPNDFEKGSNQALRLENDTYLFFHKHTYQVKEFAFL